MTPLINVFVALKYKISMRRSAIIYLLHSSPRCSTALAKLLKASRQLIDLDVRALLAAKLIQTEPAKFGTSYKPHHLTAKGLKVLEELFGKGDTPAYACKKAQNGRCECEAAKKEPCRIPKVSSKPQAKKVSRRAKPVGSQA